ncbi:MAG TPA: two-component regulator propeller domain-containing protein, partial [Ignavibacteriaceae bacterium]|nr:two-component regulator propeller domain-containing protein [Ignavibacteriaceae bacterium]
MEYLTIDQGLSQNYIFSICQDSKGFIWVGTKDGLNRFDGKRFICYRHDPFDSSSLSGNSVSTIYKDSKHRLWVGTNGGGLNLFNPSSLAFKHYIAGQNSKTLSSNFISCIFE